MAHSEIPAEKIETYYTTDYRFGQGIDLITLRIDTRSESLSRLYTTSGCSCWVFITAYNPYDQHQRLETNEAAHARLVAELRALATEVIEDAGADPMGEWPEEKSFFAVGGGSRCRKEEPTTDLDAGPQQNDTALAASNLLN